MIDQRCLPADLRLVNLSTADEVAWAIREMVVRGAPAIGAAAAFGLALTAQRSPAGTVEGLRADLRSASQILSAARPTAVNLRWALQRVLSEAEAFEGSLPELKAFVLQSAQRLADEDVEVNYRMAQHGAQLIEDGDTIIHHCNTGALATVDWGTALGVIRYAHQSGKRLHVLVDETRPRLQGARLTAWELQQYGIPFDIISDNAAGYFLQTGQVQKVLFGGDRMAANGDVANKIGSYMLALAARDNQVPVYTVVPTSTVDLTLAHGGLIPIEERPPQEVLGIQFEGQAVVPAGATARNPAFDVTPARLLSGIVTEKGVIFPPYEINLPRVIGGEENGQVDEANS
jgi:methylthioribose-1-phosphate isomerase